MPLWQAGNSVSTTLLLFENTQMVALENRRLQEQVDTLQHENISLKGALTDVGVLERADGDIIAGVLARPPLTPYDVLIVNRGTRDGVAPGLLVYAKGGVPVGTVADADQNSARVALFSSSDRTTDAWVGEDRIPATLSGEGAGAFFSLVPRESEIGAGDLVYLSGGGARAIGTVSEVQSEASSPEARLFIRPFVSPFSITWVVIGTTPL